jgi:hypothetical protein
MANCYWRAVVVCWRSFGLEVVSRLVLETSVRVP